MLKKISASVSYHDVSISGVTDLDILFIKTFFQSPLADVDGAVILLCFLPFSCFDTCLRVCSFEVFEKVARCVVHFLQHLINE